MTISEFGVPVPHEGLEGGWEGDREAGHLSFPFPMRGWKKRTSLSLRDLGHRSRSP